MADKSKIEWTDSTWNPTYGCSRVSEGCRFCYAERFIHRFSGEGQRYEGLTVTRGGRPGWTGKIQLAEERLDQPLRWQRPRRIFVNSLSDVFHENIPFEYIAAIFGVMGAATKHQFQVLTKRPDHALEFFRKLREEHKGFDPGEVCLQYARNLFFKSKMLHASILPPKSEQWPYMNVWLGVSTEDQETADYRIPRLMQMPAHIRWISAEPLIDSMILPMSAVKDPGLDWVVVGGESGPGARPMDPAWVETLHNQCDELNIPFHFKQWGLLSNNPDQDDPTAKTNGGGAKGGRLFKEQTWDEDPAEPLGLNP